MGDEPRRSEARAWIARGYALVEDVVYIGLGVLLAGTVLSLLGSSLLAFVENLRNRTVASGMIGLLDQMLLMLLIVELLYTVRVSFGTHMVVAEPFLLIGIIGVIRRILVVTAELGEQKESVPPIMVVELGVLALLITALATSLVLLRRREGPSG